MALLDTIQWFIPTYVGHTSHQQGPIIGPPVHPHLRGAYPQPGASAGRSVRFIPTYVGHTNNQNTITGTNDGSSPHTWGIRGRNGIHIRRLRFIPTYVGHTNSGRKYAGCRPVHPHIRGAYDARYSPRLRACGSSPHTWGILEIADRETGDLRFIPTYVGHTYPVS